MVFTLQFVLFNLEIHGCSGFVMGSDLVICSKWFGSGTRGYQPYYSNIVLVTTHYGCTLLINMHNTWVATPKHIRGGKVAALEALKGRKNEQSDDDVSIHNIYYI